MLTENSAASGVICCLRETGAGKLRNFRLDDFMLVNRKIAEYREVLNFHKEKKSTDLASDSMRALLWLRDQLYELGLQQAHSDVEKAIELLTTPDTRCSLVLHYMDEAIRAIDEQVKTEWTYHYGENTVNIRNFEGRWRAVLVAFPTSKFEIESALDLFALQHYTASVFHFMRAAEHGLRVLATELSVALPKAKPLSHAHWQEIITHCDKQLKVIGQTVSPGDAKDAALAFYSSALAHMHHLKDGFRNNVMHSKVRFGIDEAIKASTATKIYMELLATKLSENPRRTKGFKNGKIDWGF